jgi:hypothetical protein
VARIAPLQVRPNYSLGAGGFASGADAGATGSAVVPRSSDGAAQSPAQSLVPLTVPTSLQPIGADGFACFTGLPPLGAPVCAKAEAEKPMIAHRISRVLIVMSPSPSVLGATGVNSGLLEQLFSREIS